MVKNMIKRSWKIGGSISQSGILGAGEEIEKHNQASLGQGVYNLQLKYTQ
jgi:hypothetical protein